MGTAATTLPERNAAQVADLVLMPDAAAPEVRARRVRQRRQMYVGQVASYSLGAFVLLIYAHDGVVPMNVPSLFWVGGLMIIGIFVVMSEAGVGDRHSDHYLTVFQISAHMALQFIFLVSVPTLGIAFISVLFLIFAFGTLRMTSAQAMFTWAIATTCLAAVFLASDLPIGMPVATKLQRTASMLCFVLVIGQCAFLGLFGATLRKVLYRRSIELKAAYQRIEELAELDELTGSYNRRCIMRLLDAEVEKSQQASAPCAIALIDLDWFKRINDAHGHPRRRRGAAHLRHHHFCKYPPGRLFRPLWRRGVPAAAAGHRRRRGGAHARAAARHRRRSRLERIFPRHAGDDIRGRRDAARQRYCRHVSRTRRQRALFRQGARAQPYCNELTNPFSPGCAEAAAGPNAPGQGHEIEIRKTIREPA